MTARRSPGMSGRCVAAGAALTLAMGVFQGSASAATPDPFVSYIAGPLALTQPPPAPGLFSGPPDGSVADRLTPTELSVKTYAVSQDGNTLVVGANTVSPTADPLDETKGLVLLRRDTVTSTITATVLASTWQANPVLSDDGSTVWWVTDGKIWKRSGGTTTQVIAPAFLPRSGETISGLAVSADGSEGAVVYLRAAVVQYPNALDYQPGRIFAGSFSAGTTAQYFTATYSDGGLDGGGLELVPPASVVPTGFNGPLVWVDDTTLIYGLVEESAAILGTRVRVAFTGQLVAGGTGRPVYTHLEDFTDIHPLGTSWWMWSGRGFGTSPNPTVAPTSFAQPALEGVAFDPSVTEPPALAAATPTSAKAIARPVLVLSSTSTTVGTRAVYLSYNHYLTAVPGQTLADALYDDRGILQTSTDGLTWNGWSTTTTHSRPVPWPTTRYVAGSGVTPVLTRNTWFRWIFPGDEFTLPGTSTVTKVSVAPVVKLTITRSVSGTTVTGSATRIGGTATLYRLIGSRLSTAASVPISTTGTFSFPKLQLVAGGSYRVITTADTSWAAGYIIFAG